MVRHPLEIAGFSVNGNDWQKPEIVKGKLCPIGL
jgi:hypothetical protein